MSNGSGSLIIFIIGFACIIGGVLSISAGAFIESEEGLDIEINETTPEGKSQAYVRNTLYGIGALLLILGIIVIALALLSMR